MNLISESLDFDSDIQEENWEVNLKKILDDVDLLLNNQPNLNSIEEVQEWLGDFRVTWIQILPYYGKLNEDMLKNQYNFILNMPDSLDKKTRGSSTLVVNLANSKFKHYGLFKRVEILIKSYMQVSPEMITTLANYSKQK